MTSGMSTLPLEIICGFIAEFAIANPKHNQICSLGHTNSMFLFIATDDNVSKSITPFNN